MKNNAIDECVREQEVILADFMKTYRTGNKEDEVLKGMLERTRDRFIEIKNSKEEI